MSLIDQHFEEALQDLPQQKLSWRANRRLRKMLMRRTRELEGKMSWGMIFQRLIALPVAMALILVTTGGYGFVSSSVVKGDFLYSVKSSIEPYLYPSSGTSEDRIAFHLWLSDRRYDEVNEILQRLGRPALSGRSPLAFSPVAFAQDDEVESSDNPLDQLLLETLQRAVKQVDYALLITDEIRDVKRVTSVKNDIRSSLEKQKVFVKEAAPILQKVRLKQTRLSRQQTTRKISSSEPQPVRQESLGVTSTTEVQDSVLADIPSPVSIEQELQDLTPSSFSLDFDSLVDEPLELTTIAELIDDQLAFQESLLNTVEETVAQADSAGESEITLSVREELALIVPETDDMTSKKALTVHYEESKRILTNEIALAEVQVQEEMKVPEGTIVKEQALEIETSEVASVPEGIDPVILDKPLMSDPEPVLEAKIEGVAETVVVETPPLLEESDSVSTEKEVIEWENKDVLIETVTDQVQFDCDKQTAEVCDRVPLAVVEDCIKKAVQDCLEKELEKVDDFKKVVEENLEMATSEVPRSKASVDLESKKQRLIELDLKLLEIKQGERK